MSKAKKEIGEENLAEQLRNMLSSNGKTKKHMTSEDLDQMIEDSEYIQKWKAIPKARRERLTRKQMIAMGQEPTLAESIQVEIQGPKKKLAKKVWTGEDGHSGDEAADSSKVSKTFSKVYKNEMKKPAIIAPPHQQQAQLPSQTSNFYESKKRQKPS